MRIRDWLRKLNDAVRPMHVGDDQAAVDPLDARVTARAGNLGGSSFGGGRAPASTHWVPSQ